MQINEFKLKTYLRRNGFKEYMRSGPMEYKHEEWEKESDDGNYKMLIKRERHYGRYGYLWTDVSIIFENKKDLFFETKVYKVPLGSNLLKAHLDMRHYELKYGEKSPKEIQNNGL